MQPEPVTTMLAAANRGYGPVSLGFWVGRWLPRSRCPSREGTAAQHRLPLAASPCW